jgi:protein phosphatase
MPVLYMETATRSDVGRVRDNNEDAVVANDRLLLVADGMGGHPGGEVAAAIAASLVQAAFTGRSLDELEAAVRAANRAIWDRAGNVSALEGMGTTVCAAGLTADAELAVVHVGDSRAYLVHEDALRQLTEDHSLTAEMVRRGELTDADALEHPQRGVLTHVLGGGPDVVVDSSRRPLTAGDRVLLCTDGLFNEVAHDDIARIMYANRSLAATADGLLDLALERGGADNITVAVAEACH